MGQQQPERWLVREHAFPVGEDVLVMAVLNVKQSYVYAQQQGLLNRIGNFFGGNPNSQQQVYIAAQQRILAAARRSPVLAEAERNTRGMLNGMLGSLGFRRITVNFASPAPAGH